MLASTSLRASANAARISEICGPATRSQTTLIDNASMSKDLGRSLLCQPLVLCSLPERICAVPETIAVTQRQPPAVNNRQRRYEPKQRPGDGGSDASAARRCQPVICDSTAATFSGAAGPSTLFVATLDATISLSICTRQQPPTGEHPTRCCGRFPSAPPHLAVNGVE